MNKYVKSQIINTQYHQFLYGYNTEERTNFLKEIAKDYSITLNQNYPQAIYMEDYSLPTMEIPEGIDEDILRIVSRDYFSFAVYYQLVKELLEKGSSQELGDREGEFLKFINEFLLNYVFSKILSLESLRDALLQAKNFYQEEYTNILSNKEIKTPELEIPISFVFDQSSYMREFKKLINNSSYFAIIIDQVKKMSIFSQQAINAFVTRRINSDICMKIACDANEWMTYWDTNGMLAEDPHDYTHIALDANLNDYINQNRRKYERKN